MSATDTTPGGYHRTRRTPTPMRGVKAKRPRSAVTSGRELFIDGDSNSAWSRRYYDLIAGHVADLGGADILSQNQFSLIRCCATIECELERLDAMLSRNQAIDLDSYARVAGHLRRIFETLGLERRQRDISPPTVEQYLEHKAKQKAASHAE